MINSLADRVAAQDATIAQFKKAAELAGTKAVTASKATGQLMAICEKLDHKVQEAFIRLNTGDDRVYTIMNELAGEESEDEDIEDPSEAAATATPKAKAMPVTPKAKATAAADDVTE